MATALIVAETVLVAATVELNVPVATPLAFVVPTGCVSVFPVPVAASTTVAPATGLRERVPAPGRRQHHGRAGDRVAEPVPGRHRDRRLAAPARRGDGRGGAHR